MQPNTLLEIHTKASEILRKVILSTKIIVGYNNKIAEYKSMPDFKKYECIYTDEDFITKRDLYRRYRSILMVQYDKVIKQLLENQLQTT